MSDKILLGDNTEVPVGGWCWYVSITGVRRSLTKIRADQVVWDRTDEYIRHGDYLYPVECCFSTRGKALATAIVLIDEQLAQMADLRAERDRLSASSEIMHYE